MEDIAANRVARNQHHASTRDRISRDALRKELRRCDTLRQILLQYTAALLIQIAQTAVCNKFHSVEERLCRWLLMAHDRSVDASCECYENISAAHSKTGDIRKPFS